MITRREAIRHTALALGGTLSGPTMAGLVAGCGRERPSDYEPRVLSGEQFRLVGLIAEQIIPETDTPGARAAGVDTYIDMMLDEFYSPSARERFLAGLRRVDDIARSVVGVPFPRALRSQQVEVLEILDEEAYGERNDGGDPPFFRTMKELTVAGYYTSEIGQTVELHLPPFGEFRADVPVDDVGRAWA